MGPPPFSKNTPELQDKPLSDLAQMFLSFPQDPTPGSEALETSRLDFSVNSLAVVDQHLEVMRKRKLEDTMFTKFVLRCGAYVGEVIRRHVPMMSWHWLKHEDAARLDESVAKFEKGLSTAAILWDGKKGFWFPLGKVIKYLENGEEDSVKFFAEVVISRAREAN